MFQSIASSMSLVEFKSMSCGPVEFKGQGPHLNPVVAILGWGPGGKAREEPPGWTT